MIRYFTNIWETLSTLSIGLGITLKHLFHIRRDVVTLQYPEEKWPRPERNIGYNHQDYNVIRSRLHVDIDDCTGCLKCVRACPVDCITIVAEKMPKHVDLGTTSNDTKKRLFVRRYDIDMSECMYCNLCTYPCPEGCIFMTGGPNSEKHPISYEFSEYDRNELIYRFAYASQEDVDVLRNTPLPDESTNEGGK